jgi:HTH-type transcriptional regulator, competence development regulator
MAVNSRFGRRVRTLRAEQGWGLRKFAKAVGVSPTYLSKIERGEFPPPAEDKVVAIADALGQDRDELLALAGRVASDLADVIRARPRELSALLRAIRDLSPEEIQAVAEAAQRIASGGRGGGSGRRDGAVGYTVRPRDGVAEEPPGFLP